MVEDTSHRYQPLLAIAPRLSARAAACARLTSANSYNHHKGDPVPEAEQGVVRDPEDILDPRTVPLTGAHRPQRVVTGSPPGWPRHSRSLTVNSGTDHEPLQRYVHRIKPCPAQLSTICWPACEVSAVLCYFW
ncbi:hypothetical protein MRX96_024809 [Rhipicephalus microplus]